jgi:hypothetical protein
MLGAGAGRRGRWWSSPLARSRRTRGASMRASNATAGAAKQKRSPGFFGGQQTAWQRGIFCLNRDRRLLAKLLLDCVSQQLPKGSVSGAVVLRNCSCDAVELNKDRAQVNSCLKCFRPAFRDHLRGGAKRSSPIGDSGPRLPR